MVEHSKSISRLVDAPFRSFRQAPALQRPQKPLAMAMFYVSRNIGIPLKLRSQPAYILLDQPWLCRTEPKIHSAKSAKGRTVPYELKLQPAACSDHSGRQVHQLLDHRPDSSALHRMADRRKSPPKSVLSQNAKDFIGKSPESQHQGIGGEFSGGQSFQVQIGFDLAVKLFAQAPLFIQGDHLIFLNGKGRPPALQFQAGPDQHLPFDARYSRPVDRYLLSRSWPRNTALRKSRIAPVNEV